MRPRQASTAGANQVAGVSLPVGSHTATVPRSRAPQQAIAAGRRDRQVLCDPPAGQTPARDRAQLVIAAYENGLVAPGS
jgi:hypothetical protein